MNNDQHETFRHMIDESLVGGISAEREQSLREHLGTCARMPGVSQRQQQGDSGLRRFFLRGGSNPSMPGFSRHSGDPRSQAAGVGR